MSVWLQWMKVDEMSSKNPPYTLYMKDIVIIKSDDFIGQRLARVTLFLSSMVSVTFWDKTLVLSQNWPYGVKTLFVLHYILSGMRVQQDKLNRR